MDYVKTIQEIIGQSLAVKKAVLEDAAISEEISAIVEIITEAFKKDKKVLFCGNGGSAADAQHIAAELSGRFYKDRSPLFAEALHVNTSYLTSVANDYSFDEVYSRLVEAKGREGDVLVALSTSGNSPNIVKALEQANVQKMVTIGLTGKNDGDMEDYCGYLLKVPSSDTPRIQEIHILFGHIICQLVEGNLFE